MTHHRKIDDVVTDISRLLGLQPFLLQNLFEYRELVLNTLMNMLEFEVTRAQSNRFRDALGNEPHLNSGQPRQRDSSTVVSVEAFRFHIGLADQAEASLASVLGSVLLRTELGASGRRKNPDLAVGEYAINVEQ